VVRAAAPTALVGLSAAAGAFTEEIVRAMAASTERPIIMPLSNPTSRSEARPQDLADWTAGRALVATGSPFPPMQVGATEIKVAQCNNVYVFPGIGLGSIAVGARRVTDGMLTAAASAIGAAAPIHDDPRAGLLPGWSKLVDTATAVAKAVGAAAVADGVAAELAPEQIDAAIEATRWVPTYPELV
jgi:malate dehydrogenase (oxaloacetate-decarboxylating)